MGQNTIELTEDGVEVYWTCPTEGCGSIELDLYDQSSHAYCGACLQEYDWDEVLKAEEMDTANRLYKKLETARGVSP